MKTHIRIWTNKDYANRTLELYCTELTSKYSSKIINIIPIEFEIITDSYTLKNIQKVSKALIIEG